MKPIKAMKLTAVAGLFGLVGCSGSGPALAGTYMGNIVTQDDCSNGDDGSEGTRVRWVIQESGAGQLVINTGGVCGTLTADVAVDGASATIKPKQCPDQYPFITQISTTSIVGGALRLVDVGVDVHISGVVKIKGMTTGTCTFTDNGTLLLEETP